MSTMPDLLTPMLVLATPMLFLLVGLIPAAGANARPRLTARINETAAWLAFALAVTAAGLHAFDSARAWTLYSVPLPWEIGAFSVGAYVNGVTLIMLALVSFVGGVAYHLILCSV